MYLDRIRDNVILNNKNNNNNIITINFELLTKKNNNNDYNYLNEKKTRVIHEIRIICDKIRVIHDEILPPSLLTSDE